jgi:hypothetical protein
VRRVPPHFTIQPEPVYEVKNNADLNLTCVAVGSPMPFVKWREGLKDITPDNDVPIGEFFVLRIQVHIAACIFIRPHDILRPPFLFQPMCQVYKAVLWICDILVRIRI